MTNVKDLLAVGSLLFTLAGCGGGSGSGDGVGDGYISVEKSIGASGARISHR